MQNYCDHYIIFHIGFLAWLEHFVRVWSHQDPSVVKQTNIKLTISLKAVTIRSVFALARTPFGTGRVA